MTRLLRRTSGNRPSRRQSLADSRQQRKACLRQAGRRRQRCSARSVSSLPGLSLCGANSRPQLARGQRVHSPQPPGKLAGRQPPLPVQPAKIIWRGEIAFVRITFLAARHQVAIRVIHQLDPRHDMVQRTRLHCNVAQAIKTPPAFPRVDRSPPRRVIQEVQFLQIAAADSLLCSADNPVCVPATFRSAEISVAFCVFRKMNLVRACRYLLGRTHFHALPPRDRPCCVPPESILPA